MLVIMRKKDWKEQFSFNTVREDGHLVEIDSDSEYEVSDVLEGIPFYGYFPPNYECNAENFVSNGKEYASVTAEVDGDRALVTVDAFGHADTLEAMRYYRILAEVEKLFGKGE